MSDDGMPRELVELESHVRNRPETRPTAELRNRVMRAVAAELSSSEHSSPAEQWDGWYWAAAAAAVLIVMNLSMLSAAQMEFSIGLSPTANQLTAEVNALRLLEAQQKGTFK